MKRILLVGGGSGGHAYPLIAVADALREKAQVSGLSIELKLWGSGDFIYRVGTESNLSVTKIISGKLRRYFSILNLLDFFKLALGFIQSLILMFFYMPDIVFAKGGSDSVMPSIVAKLYFIPVITHESDAIPGLANKIIAKVADKILLSYGSSQQFFNMQKIAVVGNPVRRDILLGEKNSAMDFFKLDPTKPTLLFLGGSQGAKRINNLLLDSLVQMTKDYQIIHQCGDSQYTLVKAEVEKYIKEGQASYGQQVLNNYRLYSFLDKEELKNAYAAADLIVSRGGGQIFEIASLGKPAIVIPSSRATNNHQAANAMEFAKYGASILEEDNLTPHILISQIASFLKPETYKAVSEKIKSFARPEAASAIAELLLSQ